MSDELIEVPQSNISQLTEDSFNELATAGDIWPRLQVMGSQTGFVQEGKIAQGTYGLVRGKGVEDVGKELQVIVLCYRATAIDVEESLVLHDPASEGFKKIRELSAIHPTGYMAGIEFLVYLVDRQMCVSFYCASKSAKIRARELREMLGKSVKLGIEFIKKKYSWHAPTVQPCSTPLDHELDHEAIQAEMQKFLNPPEPEVAEEATPGRDV